MGPYIGLALRKKKKKDHWKLSLFTATVLHLTAAATVQLP